MPKTIHRHEGQILVDLLREYRGAAGLTQTELSSRLGRAQSFISDVERGQRRLDLVQLRDVLIALGCTLPEFVEAYEKRLGKRDRTAKRARAG